MNLEFTKEDVVVLKSCMLYAAAQFIRCGGAEQADACKRVYNKVVKQSGIGVQLPMHDRRPLHG